MKLLTAFLLPIVGLSTGCFDEAWIDPPTPSSTQSSSSTEVQATATASPTEVQATATASPTGEFEVESPIPSPSPSSTITPTDTQRPSPTVTPTPTDIPTPTVRQDSDGDGFFDEDDCNPENAEIFPEADEACDGADNDCDSAIDEGFDSDQDGYYECVSRTINGFPLPSDCDNDNSDIYPGATELWGNGIDEDCDGEDSTADVYVDPLGILAPEGAEVTNDIKSAVSSAPADGRIAIAAGNYSESIQLPWHSLTLVGVGPVRITNDDPSYSPIYGNVPPGSGVTFVLDNLIVHGGQGSLGDNCGLTSELHYGGGICVEGADLILSDVIVEGNSVDGVGGGLFMSDGTLHLTGSKVENNQSVENGGGLFLSAVEAHILSSEIRNNESGGPGGGLHFEEGSLNISNSLIALNQSTGESGAGNGGGLNVNHSVLNIFKTLIASNISSGFSGGLSCNLCDPESEVKNSIFSYNIAEEGGGGGVGIVNEGLSQPGLLFINNTFVANSAEWGGGIYIPNGIPSVTNCIMAFNIGNGSNIYAVFPNGATLSYSLVYGSEGEMGLSNTVDIEEGNISADPLFIDNSLDFDVSDDDYHLLSASPAIDSGFPDDDSYNDSDGSIGDMGAYGGPGDDGPPFSMSDVE